MSAQSQLPSQMLQAVPLLITESRDDYNRIRDALVDYIKPCEIMEQLYVEDLSYYSWEILRLRRCKANIINLAFRGALEKALAELTREPEALIDDCTNPAGRLALGWFSDPDAKSRILKLLAQFRLDEDVIEAEAMRNCAASLELFDKLLASVESRRNRALRGITEHRADLGQRFRANTDRIIDGEVLAVEDAKDEEPPAAA